MNPEIIIEDQQQWQIWKKGETAFDEEKVQHVYGKMEKIPAVACTIIILS